ncbi:hypothetical protein [Cryobacterium glucosi]|uniref:Uncharacterized protein n=1 Tax=Cryobacterium glucosi TaxID=1259175 RepID=A0ABY2IQ76_9MICO|nr:hypothetical protein [Cryobacterium glucosi]TFC22373.1 hypothetical protein E3O46_02670 [Cryobacterium glucosi]
MSPDLTAAIARGQGNEIVAIPALGDDGEPMVVSLVLGPTSSLISVPKAWSEPVPDYTDAVESLYTLAYDALSAGPGGFSEAIEMTDFELYDPDDTG